MTNRTLLFTFFLLLISFKSVFGQKYYEDQWKKLENNTKQGLFKSNLPVILEIQKTAMKESNSTQLIRSLKAEFSILNTTHDDEQNDEASQFFKKVNTLRQSIKGDEKLLFDVLTAEFVDDYYQQNSWKIRQRTNFAETLSESDGAVAQLETWSKSEFKNYLSKHFTALERKKNELQKIDMGKYRKVFENSDDWDYFPTLFDWNAIKEIEFLKNADFFTPNELKVNQSKVVAIDDELIAKNSGSSQLYFQHKKIDHQCSFTNCKDKLSKLQNLYNSGTESDYKVKIAAAIIDQLVSDKKYNDALNWVNKVKKQYPSSKFINNILQRETQIVNPTLTIYFETHTQANLPIHLVADAKNVNRFSLNIYEVKDDFQNFLKYVSNTYDQSKFNAVKKTLVRKESFDIQNLKDYKNHKTSLEMKPLPSGIYLAEYVVDDNIQNRLYFLVGNSMVIYNQKNDIKTAGNQLKLVSRQNGKSLPNESIKIYEYSRGNSINTYPVTTDAAAVFKFPPSKDNDYYRYYLVHQPATNDFSLIQVYGNRYSVADSRNDTQNLAQVFLDRAIYRPGQTVYFKVINTQLLNKKESVAAGVSQKITLHDANGEEISSQTFKTNEFGSYNGSFTIPSGKLNGQFSLQVHGKEVDAYKAFSVEEYKRPKFEVTMEDLKQEYKYGETIDVKGKAMTYSGIPLSNATVNYEIKKQNIRWRYFWWFPRGEDNENSILGEVKTNEKGEFTIKMDLKKDDTLEGIQIDQYEINADVTDINGETQSASKSLRVASVSHYIKANDVADAFSDDNIAVKVEAKNYNDQNLKKSFQVKLSQIRPDERIYRDNFKSAVQDLPQLSKADFVAKFPHDYFDKKETEPQIHQTLFTRTENNEMVQLGKLNPGKYKLEIFNIEGKDTIKTEKQFEVFDRKSLAGSQLTFLKVVQPKAEFSRNEKAKVYVYSSIPNAVVNIYVQTGDGETKTEQKSFKNGVLEYEVSFPKAENVDRVNVQFQVVAYNDVQTKSIDLKIASDKKPLRIETVTFRDKLQPNQKEKWVVNVLGDQNEKINAEVLANMYDQSLDQFAANTYSWQKLYQQYFILNSYGLNENLVQKSFSKRYKYLTQKEVIFPEFSWFDGAIYGATKVMRNFAVKSMSESTGAMSVDAAMPSLAKQKSEEVVAEAVADSAVAPPLDTENVDKIPVRQNLNETAFFYPNLLTDAEGNISFEFTSPEALTQWKLMFLAHTKDSRAAILEKEVVTQKEFSVTPNYPRFLREGDELTLQAKISSLVSQKLKGVAQLQVLDALTNEDVSQKLGLTNNATSSFELAENGNTVASWKIKVPNGLSSIIIKIVAKAGNYSDGEQKAVAILPNRMLVTEAVPVFVKEGQTKTFVLDNLTKNTSATASNFSNTLELTTNPIWEVMFALPSLKNDHNYSADVVFNKWFADVLASEIFKANPKMKAVFDEYQSKGLLTSNLEKNQELKQLLLEETPWVLQSQNETEQMQKLARIFDANTMRNSINTDWSELVKLQNPDGGFSWYQGYPSSYYTSLYILKNLGRINEWLKGNVADYQSSAQQTLVSKLIAYVDSQVHQYGEIDKELVWNNYVLDYLDTRHYWENKYPLKGRGATLKNLIIKKAPTAKITDFTFFGLHRAALLFNDYQLTTLSKKLLTYLKETSTQSETQGVYWKQNLNSWGWYSSKTVNHAGALEAFSKLTPNDTNLLEEMKIWLVTQKEVNDWGTSRGTAEVIFTLLNSGKSWTGTESDKATIVWGGKTLDNFDAKATGYVKTTVKPEKIDKNLGTVTVTKPGPGIVQGGLFWQYYEDLDKIKSSENYISITKELYKKVKTVNGEELQKITAQTPLKVGDKVTVRMILNTDRNMEFIHLKDMRAAGFEPLNVISGYQWKNNLGYYQSTKDASTNFYIQNMPKGKYVFEYDYICNASGTFSNGISTLQNYYAPQMNAHTSGTKVTISE